MKKYKVTKEFMNGLYNFVSELEDGVFYIGNLSLDQLPQLVKDWVFESNSVLETIKRLEAIMDWANGEDVFDASVKKYVVKRKGSNFFVGNEYLSLGKYGSINLTRNLECATRFITFEKASEWANKHFEVVEVDE